MDYAVSTLFKGRDGVSDKFRAMSAGADRFGRRARTAFKQSSGAALGFKKIVAGILTAGAIGRVFRGISRAAGGAVREFIAFDDAITAAAAKFGGIERGTEAFEALKKKAREIGAETEFTATQAAEGLRFLAKAGYDTNFAMKSLKGFVDLATASEMEFSRATDISSDVMGSFGLNVDDTAKRLTNLNRVNDVMSKAVNMANIDLEDFFETVKMAGPVAKAAGVSFEKFAAMTAWLGGAGLKGSLGGTALRGMLSSLAAQTPAATKELRKLGIGLKDLQGNLRDPIAVFDELRKKMATLGTKQQLEIINTLFGRRIMAGATVSMAGAEKAITKFETALVNSGGAARRTAELMRASIGKRLDTLKSAAIEVAFKFIDAFEKKIPGGIDAVTKKIRDFDVKPITDAISTMAKTVQPLFKTLGKVFSVTMKGMVAIAVKSSSEIVKIMRPIWSEIVEISKPVIKEMESTWGKAFREIKEEMQPLLSEAWQVMKPAIRGVWAVAKPLLKGFIALGRITMPLIADHFVGLAKGARWWGQQTLRMIRILQTTFSNFGRWLDNLFGGIWDSIVKKFKKLGGWFTDTAEKVETDKDKFKPPEIPKLPVPKKPAKEKPIPWTPAGEEIPWTPPESREQKISFTGNLNIAGAPKGSTFEATTRGAPPINVKLLGVA